MLAHPLGRVGLDVEVGEGWHLPRWWRGVRPSAAAKAAPFVRRAQPSLDAALQAGRWGVLHLQWGWKCGAAAAAAAVGLFAHPLAQVGMDTEDGQG